MAEHNLGPINLKPNKPDMYDGKRDFLAVHSWFFKIHQYLSLAALSSPSAELTDENRIMFSSSYMTSTAAAWWYTVVQSGHTPSTWEGFHILVLNEFEPADHVRRARDRLRRLRQNDLVFKYLAEFRNCILTIPEILEGELLVIFVQGLNRKVKREVLETQVSCFKDAAKIALWVDSALWSHTNSKPSFSQTGNTLNDPKELGNVKQPTDEQNRRRAHDLKNNQCVVSHKKNCRPWKCAKKGTVNNLEARFDDEFADTATFDDVADDDSEN